VRTITTLAAFVSAVLLFVFQPNEQAPKKNQRQRDIIVYSVTFGGFGLVAANFFHARDVTAQRIATFPTYTNFKDFPIALASFTICTLSRLTLVPLFAMLGHKLISTEKYHGAEHEMRVQRFAGQLWKVLFHSTVTIIPLVILRDQLWWPPGRGDPSQVWVNYPYVPQLPWLREYYLFQLGYYLHAMIVTLIQKSRPNYIQMTVHHVATIGLVSVSYFMQNNVRYGTLVFWLHDVCDVPVCLTRIFVDLPWIAPIAISYFWLMIFWVYFRLWVFPVKTVWMVVVDVFTEGWVKREDSYGWPLTTSLLVALIVMHIIWFWELCGMASVYFRTGKREDSTDAHGNIAHATSPIIAVTKKVED